MDVISYLFKTVLPGVAVIFLAFFAVQVISRKIKSISKAKKIPKSSATILTIIIKWTIMIVSILLIATIFGIKISVLWTAISAVLVMAAIGFFAGWSLISSFLASILIIVWQPFKIDDVIEILPDEIEGKVIDLSLMFTKLKEKDGNIINIPNSQVLQKIIRKKIS